MISKESEEVTEDKESYIKKFFKYMVPVAYTIDFGIDLKEDSFDMDSFTILKSTTDDRVVICAVHKNSMASAKVELYNNDKYALVNLNYKRINNCKDIVQMLFDGDENIMCIHKSSSYYNSTVVCRRKNKHIKSTAVDYFMRAEYRDGNGYDVVKYSGIEGQFTFHMKGKTVISIEAFDSPIYSINDEFVYIRDMYGVPEKIYIK